MNLLLRELRKFIIEHTIRDHLQSSAISGIIRGFPSIIRRILKPGGEGGEYKKESRPSSLFDNFQNLYNLRLALQTLRHMLQDFTRVLDPSYPTQRHRHRWPVDFLKVILLHTYIRGNSLENQAR